MSVRQPVKRRYEAPRVTDAGSLRDLTFGGAPSPLSDSGQNNMSPMGPQ
jgi:hypothetical protein